jgi:hypothetical protein
MKSKHKPISLYKDEQEIIESQFSKFGTLSDFVRFCINDKKAIEDFIKPKKDNKIQMISLYQEDLELISEQVGKGNFSAFIRHCLKNQEQIDKFIKKKDE